MTTSIVTALVLLVLYGIFIQFGPHPTRVRIQSQWQENRYVMEKYFRMSKPPAIVYVGSSLTKRLDFEEWSPCVYNLALDGESTLTGLSAVARGKQKPRRVFVEINVPERADNQKLIDHASGVLVRLSPVFYTENIPTNLTYSLLSDFRSSKPIVEKPNAHILQNELPRRQQAYQVSLSSIALERNMAEDRRLVTDLEANGASIVFFELPMHPSLETSVRAVQIRTAFRTAFPGYGFLGFDELSKELSIQTVDGVHLTRDEGKAVVRRLEPHFAEACSVERG